MITTENDTRTEYIQGLRQLADILDANPDLPLPYAMGTDGEFDSDRATFYLHSKADMVTFARCFPGPLSKEVDDRSEHYGFSLKGSLRGLHLLASVARSEVCTRRVVATREVEVTKPDPDAVAAVPTITVTETVEDVEWDCLPLLAERVSA